MTSNTILTSIPYILKSQKISHTNFRYSLVDINPTISTDSNIKTSLTCIRHKIFSIVVFKRKDMLSL